jgi:hypothetical protein
MRKNLKGCPRSSDPNNRWSLRIERMDAGYQGMTSPLQVSRDRAGMLFRGIGLFLPEIKGNI